MATHSSILAWRTPWTEEPGRLQSMGAQRVPCDLATEHEKPAQYGKATILQQKLIREKRKKEPTNI